MRIRDQRSRAREALLDVPGELDLSEARDELRRELPAFRPDTLREAEALEELEPLEVLEPSCLRIGVARKGAVERHGPRSIGAGEERAVDLRHAGRVHRLLPRETLIPLVAMAELPREKLLAPSPEAGADVVPL
jgi:hypothetical protein